MFPAVWGNKISENGTNFSQFRNDLSAFVCFWLSRPVGISPFHQWEWQRRNDGLLSWRAAARDQQQFTLYVHVQAVEHFSWRSLWSVQIPVEGIVIEPEHDLLYSALLFLVVPGVSGSAVPTGNGSGSILLNFDSEEQTAPSNVGQQRRLQQNQQPHGKSFSTSCGVYIIPKDTFPLL